MQYQRPGLDRTEAVDQLPQSGLPSTPADTGDIQEEPHQTGWVAEVDQELAALNAEFDSSDSPERPDLTGSTRS